MNDEPSVLDYVKSKLNPGKYGRLEIPKAEGVQPVGDRFPSATPAQSAPTGAAGETGGATRTRPVLQPFLLEGVWPWRAGLALAFALAAQISLEPGPGRGWKPGAALFLLACAMVAWAQLRGEWTLAPLPKVAEQADPSTIRSTAVLISLPLALAAFLAFGGNQFTGFNVLLWALAIFFWLEGVWLGDLHLGQRLRRLVAKLSQREWNVQISRWALLLAGVTILAIFFRYYQLNQVPPEMNSDHAEKLLDVLDVLNGQHRIFFPRNTGREAIGFYVSAAVAVLFGTGVSFTSLKIGMITAGLLTLPFIYLLGKEIANREVGLWATAFAAVAYWPNVIDRIALRFALYPLFVAPTLYFLIRGLRRSSRNDFILAGVFLGIGLQGYTPIRILPIVVVIAVGLYVLHRQSQGKRLQAAIHLGLLSLTSLVFFLPLLRYALENWDMFAYRSFTRLGNWERPLPGPPVQIFFSNLWHALTMMNWDNGAVWTISVPHRPALAIVSGGLFVLGAFLLLVRYLRKRSWLDLFLLLSVPLLMMPSILSLAFPAENPVLNRTGAALIPVFLLVGMALEGLTSGIKRSLSGPWGARLAWALAIVLLAWSASQNYDLVFHQYAQEYSLSAWNSSEMGQVIRDFALTVGSRDDAWVVGYPYWVDTRLVGFNAGYPGHDYAIFEEQLASTTELPGAKLFLVNPEDNGSVLELRHLYPDGSLKEYVSKYENKNFLMFFVPPQG